MDIFHISEDKTVLNPAVLASDGFLWLDATHDEVAAAPEAWRAAIARISGVQLYDLHLTDILNLKHPSYFDSTHDYALVVFRKLALTKNVDTEVEPPVTHAFSKRRKLPAAFEKLATIPVSFILMDKVLITVHATQSRTIELARTRLLEQSIRSNGAQHGNRHLTSPTELMLRLLNAMVDQYLELREPLTIKLDRWQRGLLNPRNQFNDWIALLDARNELHRLERLCEEQHDAIQELRDHVIDSRLEPDSRAHDLLLVRINDVIEHITRVLNHARRLETSLESAVQLHFASMSHRTSEIMRTLTVLTALFMPLTLVTGIFGMNFVEMPLLKDHSGFWLTVGGMLVIVVGLLGFFYRKRYLNE
jgi:magnesium transporter